jgi:hypothetical protein
MAEMMEAWWAGMKSMAAMRDAKEGMVASGAAVRLGLLPGAAGSISAASGERIEALWPHCKKAAAKS